jgi:N-acetylneuraminic acid mutarotase
MQTCLVSLRHAFGLVLSALLIACGGGGSETVSATAPVISNLTVSPAAVYNDTDPLTFNAAFDFHDADGNIATMTLRVRDESDGSVLDLGTDPLDGMQGAISGTILGEFMASGVEPGTYTVLINVTDSSDQASNVLGAPVRIAAYPWTSQLADPTAREYAASAVLDGKLYVAGGQITHSGSTPGPATNTVSVYDPASNTWSSAHPMPTARMGLTLTAHDGKLYAIGGRTDGFSASSVGKVEIYDPATNSWAIGSEVGFTPRYHAAAAVLPQTSFGDLIVVAGGEAESNVLATVQGYNPNTNAWVGLQDLPTARGQLGMAAADGKLYAIGGYAGVASQWVGTVEAYNPLLGAWAPRAAMPTARAHLSLAAINGQLLAAGGENVSRALDVLESYDPVTDVWTSKTNSQIPFARAAAGAVDHRMFVFGDGLTLRYDAAHEIR